jgi:hypothetical protein
MFYGYSVIASEIAFGNECVTDIQINKQINVNLLSFSCSGKHTEINFLKLYFNFCESVPSSLAAK